MDRLDNIVERLVNNIDLRCYVQNNVFGNGELRKARFSFIDRDGVAVPKPKRDYLSSFLKQQIEFAWDHAVDNQWGGNRVHYIVFTWIRSAFRHTFTGELRLWHPSWQATKYQLFLPIPRPID